MVVGGCIDSARGAATMMLKGTKLTKVDNTHCPGTPGGAGIQSFPGIDTLWRWPVSAYVPNRRALEILSGFTYAKGKFSRISIAGATLVNVNGINNKGRPDDFRTSTRPHPSGRILAGKKRPARRAGSAECH